MKPVPEHKKFDSIEDCLAFEVKSETEPFLFHPDVMVALSEEQEYYATKPVLVAEILSESTRKFDRVDTSIRYQKLDTLQTAIPLKDLYQA